MRIAIIGAHCTGKSTLAAAFIAASPGYAFEPEPYETLSEMGEIFSDEPDWDAFVQQIEFGTARLRERAAEANVVFERSPLDLAAYLDVLGERQGAEIDDDLRDDAADAMRTLDLVAFLPIGRPDRLAGLDPELPRLRRDVDRRLKSLVRDDAWDIFGPGGPRLVEIDGSPATRLALLRESASR